MKFNSLVRTATAACILMATALATAVAGPVRHFSVEGTYRVRAAGEGGVTTREGNETTINNIIAALDGKAFIASFDMDFGTVDSDASLDKGLFTGAVKNTSATSGGFSFTPISNSCLNPELDCYVAMENDQFGFGIDTYVLRTGFVESDSLNAFVSTTIPGAGTVIGGFSVGTLVSTSFGFFTSQADIFASASLLSPTELIDSDPTIFSRLSSNQVRFMTTYGPGLTSETGFVTFDYDVFRIAEVLDNPGLPSAVPEPETYVLMLTGLGLMGAVARRRRCDRGLREIRRED